MMKSQRIVKNGDVNLTYCHELVYLTLPYFTILRHPLTFITILYLL